MAELAKWVATTTLSKAYTDDKGKMHVTAVVSDSLTDLENDQMTRKALECMVDQFKKGIDLVDNHRATFGFGKTVGASLIMDKDRDGSPYWKVMVDVELDDAFPEARSLYKEVADGSCKKQLSIGGSVPHTEKDAIGVTYGKGGKMVRQINKVSLDHLACTRNEMAANPRTGFINAIMKSLDELKAFDGVQPNTVENGVENNDNENIEDEEQEGLTKAVEEGTQFLAHIGNLVKNGGKSMAKLLKDIAEDDMQQSPEGSFPLDDFLAEDDGVMVEDQLDPVEDGDDVVEGDESLMAAATDAGGDELVIDESSQVVPGTVQPEADVAVDPMAPVQDEFGMDKGMEELEGADEAVADMGMADEGMGEGANMGMDGMDMGMEADVDDGMGGDDWTADELEAAKAVMKARRMRMLAKQKKTLNINTLLSELNMLAQHTGLTKGLDPKRATRKEMVIAKALSDVRYVLANEVLKNKFVPESVRGMARIIKEQGEIFAPGGDFMDARDDKASGSTDIAGTNVTGADKQPVYADSAEGPDGGASASASIMTQAISDTAKLPQQGEKDEFGKSLSKTKAEITELVKGVVTQLAKNMDNKLGSQQEMVANLAKTVETLVNAKGISKSRNPGRMGIEKSTTNGTFKGFFSDAVGKATSKM